MPETAVDKLGILQGEIGPFRPFRLPKFKTPPSFLDTFIRVNKQNPIFREAFAEYIPRGKKLQAIVKKRGLKRAASTVLASIKLSSLFKINKRKNSVKPGVKVEELVDDPSTFKKRACAMLFKSKIGGD